MYIYTKPDLTSNVSSFISCMRMFGGSNNEWYVGLTNNPKHSFLTIHNVDILEIGWILSEKCPKHHIDFLKNYLTQIGCKNNPELDMKDADQIYLYKINDRTREESLKTRKIEKKA
ncbi:MAG: hypothetical protein GY714_01190 [Desulfobacterales bacterium]|nr:hypothetical protein [Desulfobacterales bacterium]